MFSLSKQTVFGVVGGDRRQAAVAVRLAEMGYPVRAFFLDGIPSLESSGLLCSDSSLLGQCDVVILPMPVSRDGEQLNAPFDSRAVSLADCLSQCREDALLFGGKVSQKDQQLAQRFRLNLRDYLLQEEMAILNAVPTAEGAVQLALEESDHTLWESRCLVCGFGRCGKALALLLKGFGAQVTIAARKQSDLALARTLGFSAVPIGCIEQFLPHQQIILNTVPAPILGPSELTYCPPDCLILDLASLPGGVDLPAAEQLGIRALRALALPGKVAPVTAGHIILDTVINMIEADSPSDCAETESMR